MENYTNTNLPNITIFSIFADIIGLIGAFSLILLIPWATIIMTIIIAFLINHLRNSYILLYTEIKLGNNDRLSEILNNNVLLSED